MTPNAPVHVLVSACAHMCPCTRTHSTSKISLVDVSSSGQVYSAVGRKEVPWRLGRVRQSSSGHILRRGGQSQWASVIPGAAGPGSSDGVDLAIPA